MTPRLLARAVLVALVALVAACDIHPLTASELYGAGGRDGGGVDLGTAPEAPADAAQDTEPTGDAAPGGCATACAGDQFCDELTSQCASRSGAGMLSGVVRDACTRQALDALVGIAGHHTCSYIGKGSYFFTGLPLGQLKLAVAKEGYRLFDTTVTIVPGGVVYDVDLQRLAPDGGADPCAAPPPAQVACTCTTPTCAP